MRRLLSMLPVLVVPAAQWAQVAPPKPPPQLLQNGVLFSDNFDGSKLRPEWELRNPDQDHFALQSNRKNVLIATQPGGCGKDGKNALVLTRPSLSSKDDYEILVGVSLSSSAHHSWVQVRAWRDDENFLSIYLYQDYITSPAVYFAKTLQSKSAGTFNSGNIGTHDVFLRIVKMDNEYSGSYAPLDPGNVNVEPAEWRGAWVLPWINFDGKLNICAGNDENTPENPAKIYSVVVRKK